MSARVPSVNDVLVETGWMEDHLKDLGLRIVEADYSVPHVYDQSHIPGAVLVDWKQDLNDPVRRDIVDKAGFEALMSRLGISNRMRVILYGDLDNWFAAFAFWIFKIYGHEDVRIMNGDRDTWIAENRPLTKEVPTYPELKYVAKEPNLKIRVFLDQVKAVLAKDTILIDVRSPREYSGEITTPPEYPAEHAQRGGHIPGAINIPWSQAVTDDGRFKSPEELKALYEGRGVKPGKPVITYCRIGERSSHTWFVLKYLLGYENVANYDGSWTEWGSMVNMPIER